MRDIRTFLLVIIALLCCALTFAVAHYTIVPFNSTESAPSSKKNETAFDRITKTNTLRCGYAVATPWFMVDPNTKKLSGVGFDFTNAMADKIGLKVDWVEETGWGVAEEGLLTNRYDMLCGSVCIDPRRARAATYSTPFLHIPLLAVVRADDHRFEAGLSAVNAPDIRVGVKTGHVFEFVANEKFPQAQKVYASDLSDDTEFFQMLKANKIDVAFSGQSTVDMYNEKNDEKIKTLNEPARFCDGAFMMPLGDQRLKYMIDNAIMELNSSGQLREILNRFVKPDPRYVRAPTLPYQEK
jgi:ABC-type amino acid transport substrate-binding protein